MENKNENKYLPTDCLYCKEKGFLPEGMTAQCKYCGSIYCFGHMRPETHNCTYRIKRPSSMDDFVCDPEDHKWERIDTGRLICVVCHHGLQYNDKVGKWEEITGA